MKLIFKALLLHVGHAVIHVEKAGDKGGVEGDLSTEDVLQVVQLFLHAVDVQVKVLLTDLPVHEGVKKFCAKALDIR